MQIDRFNGTQHAIVALVVDDFGNLISLNDMYPFAATMYQAFDAAVRFVAQEH